MSQKENELHKKIPKNQVSQTPHHSICWRIRVLILLNLSFSGND